MSLRSVALLISVTALCAPVAHAEMLAFDNSPLIQHKEELMGVGDLILSHGFALAYAPATGEPYPVGFLAVGPRWRYNGRSFAIATGTCSGSATLMPESGGRFDVHSIDLAALNGDGPSSTTFVGLLEDGGTVEFPVEIDVARGWQRLTFPSSFRGLVAITWLQGDCIENKPHMFDNLRVDRVD
jgi:hypothetical protein